MENKDKLNYDNYGFAVHSSIRKTKKAHLYVDVYYVSNNNYYEDYILTFECIKCNFLKDRARQKELETFCRKRNIAISIASVINNKYGVFRSMFPESLIELIDEIPESLIKNNEAMKELLICLNEDNKQLLTFVGKKIKERREKIKEKEEVKNSEDEKSIKELEEIKQEFGL